MRWLYSSRFAEIAITLSTWIIVTIPLWLSPFHPALVAYGIIAFDLNFLLQAAKNAVRTVVAYLKILQAQQISHVSLVKKLGGARDVQHFIIIPCYQETVNKISETIQCIVSNDYPWKANLHVVLGFESRESAAHEKEQKLREIFGGMVDIYATYHELLAEEIPGKASNQTWAVKEIVSQVVIPRGYDTAMTVLTICDADSKLPNNYFSYLTHTFLTDEDRQYHFYWAPVLLYNNFWKLSFYVRMQASLSSILRLATLEDKANLIQISTYSTSLKLIQDVGYWDVDIIPEDWHIHLQAYFLYGTKVMTVPLYTMINGDAVQAATMRRTFMSRYEQEKRWAWGVSDIAYAWSRLWNTPHIPLLPKLRKILYMSINHLLWPTSFFILTIFATVTPIINPVFKRTVMGFILPQISGLILTLGSSMLIVYTIVDILIRNKLDIKTKPQNIIILALQWYVLPIVSFFLSSVPALDAHTRLLFGKKLVYKVTEKK
jgi:cellulose synthase/poly-beta-1,6-N-acetylglucosamine synthase-like glycosyltransferase